MNKKKIRQNDIFTNLQIKEEASVEELSAMYGICEATIRRDLEEMEHAGLIIRTHGGARFVSDIPRFAKKFEDRSKKMQEEKDAIVDEVAKRIPDGAVITLDNGTTSWLLAKRLKLKKNLTVATNSMQIMQELCSVEDMKLIVSGGTYRQRNMDIIGAKVVDFFRDIYADFAILTCDGVRAGLGSFKLSETSAEIGKAMVSSARSVFVIADHSKIDASGSFRFSFPDEVDVFFTDANTQNIEREKLKNECYKIVYC